MSAVALILDTETTGVDNPDVIELAYLPLTARCLSEGPVWVQRFSTEKKIELGAMATHHIIEDDLAGLPAWPGSWAPPTGIEYLIGHNIDFDWKAIGSPMPMKRICTLALSRKYFPEADSHSLAAMTYHTTSHDQARSLVRGAHSAAVDVANVLRLFFQLAFGKCGMPTGDQFSFEHIWQLSEVARVPTHFTFGKYGPKDGKAGTAIADVRRFDPGYINWCLRSCDQVKDDPYYIKALTQ